MCTVYCVLFFHLSGVFKYTRCGYNLSRRHGPDQYDPETKQQSVLWKTCGLLDKENSTKQVQAKDMFSVFFNINGVITENWAPDEVTLNRHYY